MKNTSTRYTNPINVLPVLALSLTILGVVSFGMTDYTPVFTDLIQNKIPTTQALLRWLTVA